jgi:hypothetical protein
MMAQFPAVEDLLATLLDLSKEQMEALASDSIEAFSRLCESRETLISDLGKAKCRDRGVAASLAQDLISAERRTEAVLSHKLAEAGSELGGLHKGAGALRGYRLAANSQDKGSDFVDRSI